MIEKRCAGCASTHLPYVPRFASRVDVALVVVVGNALITTFMWASVSARAAFLVSCLTGLAFVALVLCLFKGVELWYSLDHKGGYHVHNHAPNSNDARVAFRANPIGFMGSRPVCGSDRWRVKHHLPSGKFALVSTWCSGEMAVSGTEILLRVAAQGGLLEIADRAGWYQGVADNLAICRSRLSHIRNVVEESVSKKERPNKLENAILAVVHDAQDPLLES